MYSERVPPQEPPCDTCKPQFCEENEVALQVYFTVQSQFIMSQAGPIDINHLAVWKCIEEFGVKNKKEVFEKVLKLCRWNIDRIMKKGEEGG
jgi:hypothetical protein